MTVKINNLPNYPLDRWIVARRGDKGELWYWGSYDDYNTACRAADEIEGIVAENEDS